MVRKRISFKSYNNLHKINGAIFFPSDKVKPIGVMQISHGMTEHIDRYEEFIEFLSRNGYVVAIHDHAGHGESIADDNIFGYMGKNGDEVLVNDLHNFAKIVKKEVPDLPYFMFGHSMGSFVLRKFMEIYDESKYKYGIKGFIICGTGGTMEYTNVGLMVSSLLVKVKGEKSLGKILRRFSLDSYDYEYKDKVGNWLTRDEDKVKKIADDEKGRFTFTNQGYNSMLKIVKHVSKKSWYNALDKNYNILIVSGGDDPVGNYGAGPREVYTKMLKAGVIDTEIIIYPLDRHEIINEVNRYEVYDDIVNWTDKIIRTKMGGKE